MENIYSINVVPTYSPGADEHPGHGIDAALSCSSSSSSMQ